MPKLFCIILIKENGGTVFHYTGYCALEFILRSGLIHPMSKKDAPLPYPKTEMLSLRHNISEQNVGKT